MDGITPKILFFVAIAAYIGHQIWYSYFRKCSKCGGKIRLDKYKDSMGHNVTKTTTVSFWKGPRKNTEIYKCQSCDHTEIHKYWSWS